MPSAGHREITTDMVTHQNRSLSLGFHDQNMAGGGGGKHTLHPASSSASHCKLLHSTNSPQNSYPPTQLLVQGFTPGDTSSLRAAILLQFRFPRWYSHPWLPHPKLLACCVQQLLRTVSSGRHVHIFHFQLWLLFGSFSGNVNEC